VKPKLKQLEIKKAELKEANENLAVAEAQLDECNRIKEELREKFDNQMASKQALQDKAMKTRRKMDQANRLITSLQDNKERWI
jgi:dynein heavy chain